MSKNKKSAESDLDYVSEKRRVLTRKTFMQRIGVKLIIWDFFLLIISYGLATLVRKLAVEYLAHDHVLNQDGGVKLTRAVFAAVNVWILISWATQLTERDRKRYEEEVVEDIMWLQWESERLEGLIGEAEEAEEEELEAQVRRELDEQRKRHKPLPMIEENSELVGKSARKPAARSRTPSAVYKSNYIIPAKRPVRAVARTRTPSEVSTRTRNSSLMKSDMNFDD